MPPTDDALAAVAGELYALPLGRFTAERNARAKAARDDGDRDLAARIAALPKPSAAAWLVDGLVAGAPEDLQRVLDLGDELQQAQEDADRDRLRELTVHRRTLLAEVARSSAERAEAAGQRVGDAVLEEFQQTLQVALGDPAAAAAVRTGRLVRALGADDPDRADAVAGGAPAGSPPRPRRSDDTRRREAERRLAEARRLADSAAEEARAAETLVEDRDRDAEDLRRRVAELQTRLDAAEQALAAAREAAETARQHADEAIAAVERRTSR